MEIKIPKLFYAVLESLRAEPTQEVSSGKNFKFQQLI